MNTLMRKSDKVIPGYPLPTVDPFEGISNFLDRFNSTLGTFPTVSEKFTEGPHTDIKKTNDGMSITMALAGYNKKNIDISYNNGYLTVSGKESSESEATDESSYVLKEIHHKNFNRNFPVSSELDVDSIEASFKDGILNIYIPWTEKKKSSSKKIPIK